MTASLVRSMGAAARLRAVALCLGLISAGFPVLAKAVEIPLTFEFRPSALHPQLNTFVNTTPNEGLCREYDKACDSLQSVLLRMELTYSAFEVDADERHQAFFKIPNQFQEIQLRHVDTDDVAIASWRATLLAGKYVLPVNIRDIVGDDIDDSLAGHRRLWGGKGWVIPGDGGCETTGWAQLDSFYYAWGWKFPTAATGCSKKTQYPFASMRMHDLSVAYAMRTPTPLAMKNGIYTGKIQFNVGPGQAFDFGDNVTATDSEVTFVITLTVAHEFQVTFPSAAPRVTLAPIGGWQQWTDHGTPPRRLQQELPFTLTSSSDFSVKMRCEHESGGRCGIEDLAAGTVVPVDVDVTLPGVSEVNTGVRAVEFPLVTQQVATAPRFRPDSFTVNRPSKLRFSANGNAVAEMLKAPGSRWQGDVTIIFDSDP